MIEGGATDWTINMHKVSQSTEGTLPSFWESKTKEGGKGFQTCKILLFLLDLQDSVIALLYYKLTIKLVLVFMACAF